MRVFEVFIFGIMLLIISIILVREGVHPDYVGLGVFIILSSMLLFVKTGLFRKYIQMRDSHKLQNRELLQN